MSIEDREKEFIEEYPDFGEALLEDFCIDDAVDMAEGYHGRFSSWADFARETDALEVPDRFVFYIDWERVGNDLSHDYHSVQDGLYMHIFSYCY